MIFPLDSYGATTQNTGIRKASFNSLIYSFLIAVSFAAPVLNFQLTYTCLGLVYLLHAYERFWLARDLSPNRNTIYFVAFLILTAIVGWIHKDSGTENGDLFRTLELVWVFCLVFMVADAVGYLVNSGRISLMRIAVIFLCLVPVFLAIRIGYVFYAGEVVSWSDLMRLRGQRNALIPLNPNHVDNALYFLVATLFWSSFVLWSKRRLNWLAALYTLIFVLLYGYLYLTTRTLGGFLGLSAGLGFVSLVLFFRVTSSKKKLAVVGVMIFAVIGLGSVLGTRFLIKPVTQTLTFLEPGAFQELRSQACIDVAEDGRPMLSGKFGVMTSVTYRVALGMNAYEVWKEKPLLGHGIYDREKFASSVDGVMDCITRFFYHSHSLYYDVAIRGGLFLLGVYILTIILIGRSVLTDMVRARGTKFILMLPVAVYFNYLVVENLFDLSFTSSDSLIAVLLNVVAMWILTKFGTEQQLISTSG